MTLAEQVAALRRTLHRLITRHLAHRTSRSFQELRALYAIEAEDIRTQVALADRLLTDTAAVSRMVAKLEQEGLLERQPGTDRRCVRLVVTEAGQREAEVLRDALAVLDAQAHQHLTPQEAETLSRLVVKLQAGLEPDAEGQRGGARPPGP
jgi:MarR family transcriptional regulator, transcriptional regulator for hemolysin